MTSCAVEGGCPSDYVAVSISTLCIFLLVAKWMLPYIIHKVPRPKGSSFWLVAVQVIASFNLLLSIVMALNFLKLRRRHWWRSCYLWAVWIEGPLGFGLLLGCRIVQAFQLYYIFVKRRMPPIRSHIFLPLILLPWIVGSADFRFREVKDLWRGILVSTSSIGIWVVAYVLNEIHEDIAWLQVVSRFMLLFMTSILVLAFFSLSISQPLVSLMSLRKKDPQKCDTMSHALGISDSGLLLQGEQTQLIAPNEPLDKLLLNRRFRQSFMEFADSCLAGESVHFYDEVQQLDKIPLNDPTRRIYMARHIIETYIVAGATMEVNISHRCRQEILATLDLAQPTLFENALNELMLLMKMNLAKDYWSSTFFLKLKEQATMRTVGHESEQINGWNFSPRLSSVRCADDPFHEEHSPRSSECNNHDLDIK